MGLRSSATGCHQLGQNGPVLGQHLLEGKWTLTGRTYKSKASTAGLLFCFGSTVNKNKPSETSSLTQHSFLCRTIIIHSLKAPTTYLSASPPSSYTLPSGVYIHDFDLTGLLILVHARHERRSRLSWALSAQPWLIIDGQPLHCQVSRWIFPEAAAVVLDSRKNTYNLLCPYVEESGGILIVCFSLSKTWAIANFLSINPLHL